ncbi:MAG: SDR family NAD(P)-dependent oxidoreductase [Actinobacteria bacterium]|nr:SDR family NAD(P)-dependent oxidoreductase [Actinomycetota bacterium]
MRDFNGKVVAVTGAASGIGEEIASAFSRRGASLCIADIDGEGLRRVEKRLLEQGGMEVQTTVVDVSDAGQMQRWCDELYRTMKRVDILCNNAGVALGGDFEHMTLEDLAWQTGVNLWGVIHGCYFFYPRMVAQGGGHIVNTASAAGLAPFAGLAMYCATKHGVVGLSETLRAEAALHGIGVTAICPGLVTTPIVKRSRIRSGSGRLSHEELVLKLDRLLQRRGCPPARVAEAVVKAVEKDVGLVRITPEAYLTDWACRGSRGAYITMMKAVAFAARRVF